MASTAFTAAKFLRATHLDSSPCLSPLRSTPTANLCFSPLSAASLSFLLRLRSPSPSGPGGKLPPTLRSYGGGGRSGDAVDSGGDGRRGGILGLFLAGWAARVAADPQFPFKVLMEELVGVSACVLGDMASRPNFGLNELDFVFSTLVVGSILNFVLMYLLAPTAGVSAAASSHLLPVSPRSPLSGTGSPRRLLPSLLRPRLLPSLIRRVAAASSSQPRVAAATSSSPHFSAPPPRSLNFCRTSHLLSSPASTLRAISMPLRP